MLLLLLKLFEGKNDNLVLVVGFLGQLLEKGVRRLVRAFKGLVEGKGHEASLEIVIGIQRARCR